MSPDKLKQIELVTIGGSAGSFQPVVSILSSLTPSFDLPIFLCLHRLKHIRHGFVEALSIKSKKKVVEPYDKELIQKNTIYLAPANYHLCIGHDHRIELSSEPMFNNSRPAIDHLFASAAQVYRHQTMSILLSGANKDGAIGTKAVCDHGGITIVQDADESLINTMPNSPKAITTVDMSLTIAEIIALLNTMGKKH